MFSPEGGYVSLFFLSFLASTILPLGSEWLLAALLLNGFSTVATVTTATVGNYLGAVTTYLIGRYAAPLLESKLLRTNPQRMEQATNFYTKYGVWTLFLSWVPIFGDLFCIIGGIMKVHFTLYTILVFSGKLARYAIVAWLTLATI